MQMYAAAEGYSRWIARAPRSGQRRRAMVGVLALLGMAAVVPAASAQTIITPFVGYDLAGASLCQQSTQCPDGRSATKGIAYGRLRGFFGQEQEIGVAPGLLGPGSRPLVFMTNFMLVAKAGRLRPYVEGGPGLMYSGSRSEDDGADAAFSTLSRMSFGGHAGGGLMVDIYKGIGLRADIRQFRSFGSLADVSGGGNDGIDADGSSGADASAPPRVNARFRRVTASVVLRF